MTDVDDAVGPEGVPADQTGEQTFSSVAEAVAFRREQGPIEMIETPDEVFPPSADEEDDDGEVTPPVVTTPPAPVAPAAPAPDADPLEEFGGRQRVQDALVIANSMRTELGLKALVAQGIDALRKGGYTNEQVAQILQQPGGVEAVADAGQVPADPFAGIEDDDVVTGAELKGVVSQAVRDAVEATQKALTAELQGSLNPLQEQIQRDQANRARVAVDSTVSELLGEVPPENTPERQTFLETLNEVQQVASTLISPDDWDPEHITAALRNAHAYVAERHQRQVSDYLRKKAALKKAQPTNIGGQTPGGEDEKEPQTVAEAIERRKALGIV